MKKSIKKIISAVTALTLCLSSAAVIPANAADEYETISGLEWTFDSESDASSWSKGDYWSLGSDVTPTITSADGVLKYNEDFTAISGTWNQSTIKRSITSGTASDAVRVTYDYYTTEVPEYALVVFSGTATGTYTKADGTTVDNPWVNVEARKSFSAAATEVSGETITIGETSYQKYSVTIDLDVDSKASYYDSGSKDYADLTRAQALAGSSSFTIGEIRTDAAYSGYAVFDNIKIQKKAAGAVETVTLDSNIAEYNKTITASADGGSEYQWYVSTTYAGEGTAIEGAAAATFTPTIEQIGGWLCCNVNGTNSDKVRVVASTTQEMTENYKIYSDGSTTTITNVKTLSGSADVTKWAGDGYVYVELTGLSNYDSSTAVPMLSLNTWASSGETLPDGVSTKRVAAYESGKETDGTVWAKYSYKDILAAWTDPDFNYLKSIGYYANGAKADGDTVTIKSAKYVGPCLSFGDLCTPVEMRGSYSGYQYLFTRHVGKDGSFDATKLREEDKFYVEYAEADAAKTVNLVAQSHSAKADGTDVKNTYATISPSESGKTGSGRYAVYTVAQIKEAFGSKFRYLDGIRISPSEKLTADASLYLIEGTGAYVDDIGSVDAVTIPWTLYDNDENLKAKDGIAVIGASITQNPLVTALAMSGKPFYSANGGWSPMLDRTDVATYGIGSQTTDDIAARFHEVLDYNYKQIIIQCGNNDLGAYSTGEAAAEAEYNNYVKMLNMVQNKYGSTVPVHIVSINPVSSLTTNEKIQAVIKKLKTLEDKYDFVNYIEEINDEFLDTASSTKSSQSNLVMSDGLHPVAEGYAIYARYLKPLLATNDDADATLSGLSYRVSGDFNVSEAKTVITGFKSGAAGGSYSAELPAGTTSFRLYTTASNTGKAKVTMDGAAPMVDEYGNEYFNISVSGGAASASVLVTAANGTTTNTYTVDFTVAAVSKVVIDKSSEPLTITTDETNKDSWSIYGQYTGLGGVTVNKGATVEFDLKVSSKDFTNMQMIVNFNWKNACGSGNLTPSDFDDNNTKHFSLTYDGYTENDTTYDSIDASSMQFKPYGAALTFTVSNVKVTNP